MDDVVKKYKIRRDARLKARMDEFNENDHPRDENGRFASGGGGGSAPKKESGGKTGKDFTDSVKGAYKSGKPADVSAAVKGALNDMPVGGHVKIGKFDFKKVGDNHFEEAKGEWKGRKTKFKNESVANFVDTTDKRKAPVFSDPTDTGERNGALEETKKKKSEGNPIMDKYHAKIADVADKEGLKKTLMYARMNDEISDDEFSELCRAGGERLGISDRGMKTVKKKAEEMASERKAYLGKKRKEVMDEFYTKLADMSRKDVDREIMKMKRENSVYLKNGDLDDMIDEASERLSMTQADTNLLKKRYGG